MRLLKRWDYHSPDGIVRWHHEKWLLDRPKRGRMKEYYYKTLNDRGFLDRHIDQAWKHLIYNLPAVLEGIKEGKTIWWTEGEADADALIAQGLVATTHHGGRERATEDQARWLVGATKIILVRDLDPAGALDVRKRLKRLLAVGVPEESIQFVRGRCSAEKSDVEDHLRAGFAANLDPEVGFIIEDPDEVRIYAWSNARLPPERDDDEGYGYHFGSSSEDDSKAYLNDDDYVDPGLTLD